MVKAGLPVTTGIAPAVVATGSVDAKASKLWEGGVLVALPAPAPPAGFRPAYTSQSMSARITTVNIVTPPYTSKSIRAACCSFGSSPVDGSMAGTLSS
jgi:hypothetical protein